MANQLVLDSNLCSQLFNCLSTADSRAISWRPDAGTVPVQVQDDQGKLRFVPRSPNVSPHDDLPNQYIPFVLVRVALVCGLPDY